MSESISYTTALNVSSVWAKIKRSANYEERLGELIFQPLFALSPNAVRIFNLNDDSDDLRNHAMFKHHAHTIVDMIDCAVQFLGPNLDSLEEFLVDLGKRHIRYGTEVMDLKAMGLSAVYAVSIMVGSKFTRQDSEHGLKNGRRIETALRPFLREDRKYTLHSPY